jgi:hypothetical protein
MFQQAQQHAGKAKDTSRRLTGAGAETLATTGGERKEGAISQGVPVN